MSFSTKSLSYGLIHGILTSHRYSVHIQFHVAAFILNHFIFLFQGAVVSSYTVVELTVIPGENVTLHCDCKRSLGENIVWYRNCSHENQPTFTLNSKKYIHNLNYVQNLNVMITNSYNLLIKNISDSHLGLYYCGTEESNVTDGEKIVQNDIHRYGNVTTRISFGKLTLCRCV